MLKWAVETMGSRNLFSKIEGWKDIRPKREFKPWSDSKKSPSKKNVKKKI